MNKGTKRRRPIIDADDPENVVVYTDGSCYPNPDGPGGWSFYCTFKGKHAVRYGFSESSTNNIMEMTAILHALLYVPLGPEFTYPLIIFTDSQYCRNSLTEWVEGWAASGWKTAQGKPVKNKELIHDTHNLLRLHRQHREVDLRWVRGHTGIPENELCDQRANFARKQQATNWASKDQKNY
jgi:ribonuclease HI